MPATTTPGFRLPSMRTSHKLARELALAGFTSAVAGVVVYAKATDNGALIAAMPVAFPFVLYGYRWVRGILGFEPGDGEPDLNPTTFTPVDMPGSGGTAS